MKTFFVVYVVFAIMLGVIVFAGRLLYDEQDSEEEEEDWT